MHHEPDGRLYPLTIQHADVNCIIISVTYLVTRDCWATFHKHGRHIKCPDGRRVELITKDGVFFVPLNVLPRIVKMCLEEQWRVTRASRVSPGMASLEPSFSELFANKPAC